VLPSYTQRKQACLIHRISDTEGTHGLSQSGSDAALRNSPEVTNSRKAIAGMEM
jgi:hypothetical protein